MPRITKYSPLVLLILDGWGFSKQLIGNAILQSKTPNLDEIRQKYPFALLQASGLAVGMDWGEAGNSEIGHMTIGAGRQVEQYSLRINKAIKDGSFFGLEAFTGAFDHAARNNSTVHLAGLLTSGSVHASFEHILALLKMAGQKLYPVRETPGTKSDSQMTGISNGVVGNEQCQVKLHLFMDGRDSGQQEGVNLLVKLETDIGAENKVSIATLMGRDIAMDRDNKWDHTGRAYNLITQGQGMKIEPGQIIPTIHSYYEGNITDSDIPPTAVNDYQGIRDGDSLVFFNFREDSMRQIARSFVDSDSEFNFFPRIPFPNLYVASMTEYIKNPLLHVAFAPPKVKNSLTEVLSNQGFNQLHIAETEKYAHVTYFFNGITSTEFPGETDFFIQSNKDVVKRPKMEVDKITDKVLEEIDHNAYEFVVINFANGDMLAHEGSLENAKKGIAFVDTMIGRLQDKILDCDGVLVITADHGNVESMTYKGSGVKETKHETNPVPFYLIGREYMTFKDEVEVKNEEKNISGILADVAPTILAVMGIPQPPEMTGQNLLATLGRK